MEQTIFGLFLYFIIFVNYYNKLLDMHNGQKKPSALHPSQQKQNKKSQNTSLAKQGIQQNGTFKKDLFKTLRLLKQGGHSQIYSTSGNNIVKRKKIKKNHIKRLCSAYANNWQLVKTFNSTPQFSQYFIRFLKIDREDDYQVSTMQAYNKQLNEILQGQEQLCLEFKISLVLQIIIAVNQLHERKIIHCDLTPRNILIDDDNTIKICDFDNAIFYQEDYSSFIGTPQYKTKQYYKKLNNFFFSFFQQEIRSIAIIASEIFYESYPYEWIKTTSYDKVCQQIQKRKQKNQLQLKCQNIQIKNTILTLLQELQTKNKLKDIIQGQSFIKLKQYISKNKQYRIIEFKQYYQNKYISNQQFIKKEETFKSILFQIINDNLAVNQEIKKISDRIQYLSGGFVNTINQFFSQIPKNQNQNVDLKGFTYFVKEKLNLNIRSDILAQIFDYLDSQQKNGELDPTQITKLCKTILTQSEQEKLIKKLLNRQLLVHRKTERAALTQKNMNRR